VRRLGDHTTLRLGGPAPRWEDANDEDGLIEAALDSEDADLFLLGGGSNVVVADEEFDGTVVHVRTRGILRHRSTDDTVGLWVEAGEDWDELVELTVNEGLAGIECLSGIPGTVGAAPMQNIGAYGQSVKGCVASVRAFDRELQEVVTLSREECDFEYRDSRFKREAGKYVVLTVELELRRQPHSLPIDHKEVAERLGVPHEGSAPLAEVREAVMSLRRTKGMVLDEEDRDTWSTGSFFTNPLVTEPTLAELRRRMAERGIDPGTSEDWSCDGELTKVPAAWLIQEAGISKGDGNPDGIAISSKHTLALTNRGRGTTAELVELARSIAATVQETWGLTLTPEPEFVGHEWPAVSAARPGASSGQ
jgi:UDP-N-acetylmuramate dehydrogenase